MSTTSDVGEISCVVLMSCECVICAVPTVQPCDSKSSSPLSHCELLKRKMGSKSGVSFVVSVSDTRIRGGRTEGDVIIRMNFEGFKVDVEKEGGFGNGVNRNWALRKLSGGLSTQHFPSKGDSNSLTLKSEAGGEGEGYYEENTSKSEQDKEGKDGKGEGDLRQDEKCAGRRGRGSSLELMSATSCGKCL